MIILNTDEIIGIYEAVMTRYGGFNPRTLNTNDLQAKVESLIKRIRVVMTFKTAYDWDNAFLCAALHASCIAKAHVFLDGNKRTALNAAGLVLKQAGYQLQDSEKLPELIVEIAQRRLSVKELAKILQAHMTDQPDCLPEAFRNATFLFGNREWFEMACTFAEEKTAIPTLNIVYRQNQELHKLVLTKCISDVLSVRYPEYNESTFKFPYRKGFYANQQAQFAQDLKSIRECDLLLVEQFDCFCNLNPQELQLVVNALDARRKVNKRTIIISETQLESLFNQYQQGFPACLKNILTIDLTTSVFPAPEHSSCRRTCD